ncbi:MAG: hypothetical protein R2856_31525 [Caldilineaceae bacterium]
MDQPRHPGRARSQSDLLGIRGVLEIDPELVRSSIGATPSPTATDGES